MSEYTKLFERAAARFESQSLSAEGLLLRRDRKRRNQRITAGAVGFAVFAAAVWAVTSLPFEPSAAPDVPGGIGTGSTDIGSGPTRDPSSVGFESGLPPEGVPPSEPPRGELIMKDEGIHPWWHVRLYADGRLIWAVQIQSDEGEGEPQVSQWIEQRLTPEGVELLRSGAVELGRAAKPGRFLPASAWEDPELRSYVPSTYAVCAGALASLPDPAADLLRSTERIPASTSRYVEGAECFELTIDDARALAEILGDAGFDDPQAGDTALYSSDANDVTVEYQLILPDGIITVAVGG